MKGKIMKNLQNTEHELIEASILFSKACEICEEKWNDYKAWKEIEKAGNETVGYLEMKKNEWVSTLEAYAKLFDCDIQNLM